MILLDLAQQHPVLTLAWIAIPILAYATRRKRTI